jgi:two-component system CheB/CheR fusion protein
VVGIGASAGGLEACGTLLDAMSDTQDMAFVLVQHLDPTRESLMVDLLSTHTAMAVSQAQEGMTIRPNNLYIIPPGMGLTVTKGTLHLSEPKARHGARLPFDDLLVSLAQAYGSRAVCVVLSGTGADGSVGLKAIKAQGGWVIAQSPEKAGFDGMPLAAIDTGQVDQVLPLEQIPQALSARSQNRSATVGPAANPDSKLSSSDLERIIDLLRSKTAHDFTPYKPGTLLRRLERRMALAGLQPNETDKYIETLHNNAAEADLLAKDLLINVTNFFRDPKVFEHLATDVIPQLIANTDNNLSLRLWIVGCSTGEEAYSLAILFRDALAAAKSTLKLQVFASDADAHAVAVAREGLYPLTIDADVSADRLSRHFTREDQGYRVTADLRASVIFTVQDVLTDPPFSRLDMVSCRNLMIYLAPDAQAKVISLFHFALRPGGLLLLGSAETTNSTSGLFDVVHKPSKLYKKIGRSKVGAVGVRLAGTDTQRQSALTGSAQAANRVTAYADLCRRTVTESFAPAAVLANAKLECLYSMGPVDRFLRLAPGLPSHDLLAMTPHPLRARLREAALATRTSKTRTIAPGGTTNVNGTDKTFTIDVQPVTCDGEDLMLICFVETTTSPAAMSGPLTAKESARVTELEQALATAQSDLKSAIQTLEMANEEQRAVNEEALSVNEEYQSTNEELLTSKEELQSLNEELTALNSQLQETLERQRTTSDDLQNVLYSTDVATLFLDTQLNIRFFTPATKSFFNILPGDVGRPLADLNSLASDITLTPDARRVLRDVEPLEREIEGQAGVWFVRRILPYRTHDGGVEGVVITFIDITESKTISKALEAAKQQAELANLAKSRFLAAASHDLRQPLQALALLQGLLSRIVQGDRAKHLVARLDETLGSMTGMLDTLLDINQIDAGTVTAEISSFKVSQLFDRLRDEFSLSAQAKGLELRVLESDLSLTTDVGLLEQMVRNFLSNAIKYAQRGKILLGCRRRGDLVRIEVWDTGIGIPADELQAIFEEYHQLDNPARERGRGLGLGLSIVKRLSRFLGHPVAVRSVPGLGSVFSIDVPRAILKLGPNTAAASAPSQAALPRAAIKTGAILIIEDDPEVRALLGLFLQDEGHKVLKACDGKEGLALVRSGAITPDLILADYNLPGGLTGLEAAAEITKHLRQHVPVIILTGDISTTALRAISTQPCLQLNKPVKLSQLSTVIQHLLMSTDRPADLPELAPPVVTLTGPALPGSTATPATDEIVYVVDDDRHVREALTVVLESSGRTVVASETCEEFLTQFKPSAQACLLVDAYLPGMSGLDLLEHLHSTGVYLPAIMITANSDVGLAVQAMKAGAFDFIEKPISHDDLLASIERLFDQSRDAGKIAARHEAAHQQVAGLTARQRQIMDMVLRGEPSKNIAADLGISQRTVENHRAAIMKRTGSKSVPALARLAIAAADIADPS